MDDIVVSKITFTPAGEGVKPNRSMVAASLLVTLDKCVK